MIATEGDQRGCGIEVFGDDRQVPAPVRLAASSVTTASFQEPVSNQSPVCIVVDLARAGFGDSYILVEHLAFNFLCRVLQRIGGVDFPGFRLIAFGVDKTAQGFGGIPYRKIQSLPADSPDQLPRRDLNIDIAGVALGIFLLIVYGFYVRCQAGHQVVVVQECAGHGKDHPVFDTSVGGAGLNIYQPGVGHGENRIGVSGRVKDRR